MVTFPRPEAYGAGSPREAAASEPDLARDAGPGLRWRNEESTGEAVSYLSPSPVASTPVLPTEDRLTRRSPSSISRFLLQAVFNMVITQLPGHWLRQTWLRLLG